MDAIKQALTSGGLTLMHRATLRRWRGPVYVQVRNAPSDEREPLRIKISHRGMMAAIDADAGKHPNGKPYAWVKVEHDLYIEPTLIIVEYGMLGGGMRRNGVGREQ